ncbi:MAG: hypothetical protein OJF49_003607 [Ktedonobacterales bacterium]|jgi:hypothetical protein|nr:MAG: hypothetical protein OJF49_003607 [Ktedonobacterales bacterium]
MRNTGGARASPYAFRLTPVVIRDFSPDCQTQSVAQSAETRGDLARMPPARCRLCRESIARRCKQMRSVLHHRGKRIACSEVTSWVRVGVSACALCAMSAASRGPWRMEWLWCALCASRPSMSITGWHLRDEAEAVSRHEQTMTKWHPTVPNTTLLSQQVVARECGQISSPALWLLAGRNGAV